MRLTHFRDGLRDNFLYQGFVRHSPKTIVEFLDTTKNWIDANEGAREKFGDQNNRSNDRSGETKENWRGLMGKKQGPKNYVVAMSKSTREGKIF